MNLPPSSIADAVARELIGEQVLWADSPVRWAYAKKQWKTALLGIPFTAFSVFWTYGASQVPSRADSLSHLLFILWGLMFVGFGLSMVFRPFWAAWAAGNVYYVVTDKRAVIFEKPFSLKIQSFSSFVASGFDRVSSGGPGGDIILMRVPRTTGKGRTIIKEIGFIGLSDCASAESAIKKMSTSQNPA